MEKEKRKVKGKKNVGKWEKEGKGQRQRAKGKRQKAKGKRQRKKEDWYP